MAGLILVAEDDPDLRRLYVESLRRAGYQVAEASDGAEAVTQIRSCRPDLLLLDVWMPVLNGLEVLEQLSNTAEAVGLKVILLSHQGDADTRLEGFAFGAVDYWTKDLSLDELTARIEQTLGPSPGAAHFPSDD